MNVDFINSDKETILSKEAYKDFTKRFGLLIKKHPTLITMTLSNIFTMRLIGNKTHGDLAEIAISEFINQYMDGFSSRHVGKENFRDTTSNEEDIVVTNESTKETIPISLKAYGNNALQLSTDKNVKMYPLLETYGDLIDNAEVIKSLFNNTAFSCFSDINVLPLIYNENKHRCNILVFDAEKAMKSTHRIKYIDSSSEPRRKHSIYRFTDKDSKYICEVRCGGKDANPLQRGLWTNTKNAFSYFESIKKNIPSSDKDGWIPYSYNYVLVHLLSQALIIANAI
jgi:hypothetical protein